MFYDALAISLFNKRTSKQQHPINEHTWHPDLGFSPPFSTKKKQSSLGK